MAKKPQAMNKKVLMIGGGIIVVLALLLVGVYGNSIKTQLGEIGIAPENLHTPECILARDLYTVAMHNFRLHCTPRILLSISDISSQNCNGTLLDLIDAEDNKNKHCLSWEVDEDGVFLPPILPPTLNSFATITPEPQISAPATPGV